MVVCFMAILELVKNKQVVAKQSELFEDIRIYRVYNKEEDDSIVKEQKDEFVLDIPENIPEQKEPVVQQDVPFNLEQESINSQNKDIGATDGN